MIAGAVTDSLLRAKVEAVCKKEPQARAIGIKVSGPWHGIKRLVIGDKDLPVVYCPSVLALREQLAQDDAVPKVLLTDRSEQELGTDVIFRLALARLHEVQPWQIILERFAAKTCDPKLTKESWMERHLLRIAAEKQNLAPAPGGFLDEDTIWRELLSALIKLDTARPSATELLRWTLESGRLDFWGQLSADTQEGMARYLAEQAGAAGPLILGAVAAERGADAVPLGLVCGLLFTKEATSPAHATVVLKATGRLEAWLSGRAIGPEEAGAWATASQTVLAELGEGQNRIVLERAEALLRELKADSLIMMSTLFPSSLELRLGQWGEALSSLGSDISRSTLDRAERAFQTVRSHQLWAQQSERRLRLFMARRVAWALVDAGAQDKPRSFAEAVDSYSLRLSWLDRAREVLVQGDENPVVAKGMAGLVQRVMELRESFNRQFGQLLVDWTASGSHSGTASGSTAVGVESILEAALTPVAKRSPVLLLVLDGMSVPVFLTLREDLARIGWVEAGLKAGALPRQAIAMLPTETEASRASLLSGVPLRGQASLEKDRFARHPALRSLSKGGKPPVLFHKADLIGESVGLEDEVRRAIEDPEQQIVGVIVNAIDDHLAKGDQIAAPQTVDAIRPLGLLLATARAAGRVVLVTSDHGHVLERELTYRRTDGKSSRYRPASGTVAQDEVLLQGARVLTPTNQVIAPWSERIRYGHKKSGYHGGASPQEVIVPVALLVPTEQLSGEWQEQVLRPPAWWNPDVFEGEASVATAAQPIQPAIPEAKGAQGVLFSAGPALDGNQDKAAWIDRLLASATFTARQKQFARLALPRERITDVLSALDRHGDKLLISALAQLLGLPPVRLRGILGALRTLLNIDAYSVLTIDEGDMSVTLDRPLLERQFELSGTAAARTRESAQS